MTDTDRLAALLQRTTDAHTWALEYVRLYPVETPGFDTVLGWFANAIEAGRAAGVTLDPRCDFDCDACRAVGDEVDDGWQERGEDARIHCPYCHDSDICAGVTLAPQPDTASRELREAAQDVMDRLPAAWCYRQHLASDANLAVSGAVWKADLLRALPALRAALEADHE